MLDAVVRIAPAISALAVCISLVVAIIQIIHYNRRQRQQTARSLYGEFIKTGINYPVFAYPPRFSECFDFDKQEISGSKQKFEQYEWFLSLILVAAREIMESMPGDVYWEKVILRNFRYHRQYFAWRVRQNRPDDFVHNRGPRVYALIKKVTDEQA